MMRRYSLNARRALLAFGATLVASLAVATTAQAIVLNDANAGGTEAGVALTPDTRTDSLPSNVSAATTAAACLDPWLSSDLGGPNLSSSYALCYRGGSVMHKNETFALTWDAPQGSGWALHNYWSQTRGYVERFLRDVADASGSLGSPFAVTSQYNDSAGRAQNASVFGGGCIDYGAAGGSACEFSGAGTTGHDFPTGNCTAQGASFIDTSAVYENSLCVTDSQIQDELKAMIPQTGIIGRTQPGYTPLVTLLLPPGVEACLDNQHALCSTNANVTPPPPGVSTVTTGGSLPDATYQVEISYELSGGGETAPSSTQSITTSGGGKSVITIAAPPQPADPSIVGWYAYVTGANGNTYKRLSSAGTFGSDLSYTALGDATGGSPVTSTSFCSYHSQVNVSGTDVAYVVQPWTMGTDCDEPGLPDIPHNPTPAQLSLAAGARLVSPLSQSEIASIINPGVTSGWIGKQGYEIQDNRVCYPLTSTLDSVTVGSSSQNPYYLEREFNNAAVLDSDPNTYGCAPSVILSPDFVAPSSVNPGDVVQFDGSATASTLIVPNAGYAWNFGDGTTAAGPSVVHSFAKGGTYNVTLTVTDRGGNTSTLTQSIQVLGDSGQPGAAPPAASPNSGSGSGSGSGGGSGSGAAGGALLRARLQLLPQSLKMVLHRGIAVRVKSNKAANGIATVWITRAAAKRMHIKVRRGRAVRIGIGTVASIRNGTVTLRLHLSPAMRKKLAHLKHIELTVRLALVATGNQRYTIDAAGRY